MTWVIRLSSFHQKRILEAIAYVEKHYTEAISADHLSVEFDMDARRLQAGFKKLTGLTIHLYIVQHRILKAMEDLDNSNFTLKVIAEMHGFASESHFIDLFKKKTGITPTQYRKSGRS